MPTVTHLSKVTDGRSCVSSAASFWTRSSLAITSRGMDPAGGSCHLVDSSTRFSLTRQRASRHSPRVSTVLRDGSADQMIGDLLVRAPRSLSHHLPSRGGDHLLHERFAVERSQQGLV